MKYFTRFLIIPFLLSGGMGMMSSAMATEHGMSGMHMGQGKHMMHGKGEGKHGGWKSTLSAEQKSQLRKLKLAYKQKVYPIKARIKQAKVELALLVTSNNPDQKQIDSKIDDILKMKGEKMRAKAMHKIEVRKILNEDQRLQFDMKMLKKAFHGKKGGKCGHGRGGH